MLHKDRAMLNDPEASVIIAHDQHKHRYREESMAANGLQQCIGGVVAEAGKQDAWIAALTATAHVLGDVAVEPKDPSLPPIPCVFDLAQACVDDPVDQPEQPRGILGCIV